MDPVLKEIYSTVFDAAPYVIAAYALLWAGLIGYITVGVFRVSKVEKELSVVEDAMRNRGIDVASDAQ